MWQHVLFLFLSIFPLYVGVNHLIEFLTRTNHSSHPFTTFACRSPFFPFDTPALRFHRFELTCASTALSCLRLPLYDFHMLPLLRFALCFHRPKLPYTSKLTKEAGGQDSNCRPLALLHELTVALAYYSTVPHLSSSFFPMGIQILNRVGPYSRVVWIQIFFRISRF